MYSRAYQLHQVVIDCSSAALHNEDILAAHGFSNLDPGFADCKLGKLCKMVSGSGHKVCGGGRLTSRLAGGIPRWSQICSTENQRNKESMAGRNYGSIAGGLLKKQCQLLEYSKPWESERTAATQNDDVAHHDMISDGSTKWGRQGKRAAGQAGLEAWCRCGGLWWR